MKKKYEYSLETVFCREFIPEKEWNGKWGNGGIDGFLIDGKPECFRLFRNSQGRYNLYDKYIALAGEIPPEAVGKPCVIRLTYKLYPDCVVPVAFEFLSVNEVEKPPAEEIKEEKNVSSVGYIGLLDDAWWNGDID